MRAIELLARVAQAPSLLRPLRAPAVPRAPRALALAALRFPRLVPVRLRWRSTVEGLGLVVARLSVPGEAPPVQAVLEAIGEEQGRQLRAQLGYGRDPLECARAVALANRLVGIAASAEEAGPGEATVTTPGCAWSENDWWGALPCGAFSRYELGLTRGLNPEVRLRYVSKKTRGDESCVGVYTMKGEAER